MPFDANVLFVEPLRKIESEMKNLRTPQELLSENNSWFDIDPDKKCHYAPKNWWGDGEKPDALWSNEEWFAWAKEVENEPETVRFGDWYLKDRGPLVKLKGK